MRLSYCKCRRQTFGTFFNALVCFCDTVFGRFQTPISFAFWGVALPTLIAERMSIAAYEQFRTESPHATAFNTVDALTVGNTALSIYGIRRGQGWLLAWPLSSDSDGEMLDRPFHYYLGPMLHADLMGERAHRSLLFLREGFERLFELLLADYREFSGCLPRAYLDVRPVRWAAESLGASVQIAPRYSAVLPAKCALVMAHLTRSRQRDLRSAIDLPLVACTLEPDALEALYVKTFSRQGKTPNEQRLLQLRQLLALVKATHGYALGYRTSTSEALAAASLILTGCGVANNVLTLTDELNRSAGLTARLTLEAIEWAELQGLSEFDFNGANSPDRALDKALYGAQPVPYFRFQVAKQPN